MARKYKARKYRPPTPDQQDRNRQRMPGDAGVAPKMPRNQNMPDYPHKKRNGLRNFAPGQRDSDWRKRNA